MKIAVIFHRKKFMVVVANDDYIQDLKVEILRVYKGLCPTCSSPPPISEVQTPTGCVLFDGYTVSSVLSDNDLIIATSDAADSERTPPTMPAPVQGSPLYWPYCGFSPMCCPLQAAYSPMLAAQMAYNNSPASSTLLPEPLAASAPSSLLATPTKTLFQSPSTRTVSVQYPSPQRTESESENDISVCSLAPPTPPSGIAAVERRTQAVETVQVHDVGSNSHVLNASSGEVEEEADLQQVSAKEQPLSRTGGDITVLPCSGGEDLCDNGEKPSEPVLKKFEVAIQDIGSKGTATTSPSLSRMAKKVGKRRTVESLQSHATSNGGSTVVAGSANPKRRPVEQSLGSAVRCPRRVASQAASLRMQEISTGVNSTRDYPSPVIRKRMRRQSVGSEDEGKPEAKRKNMKKDKTHQQGGNFHGAHAQESSSETSSDWGTSDSEEIESVLHSAKKDASTTKEVDKQKQAKSSTSKGKELPNLVSSSDWTSSDEDDRSEELCNSELKRSSKTAKGRGGDPADMSGTETQSVDDSSMSPVMAQDSVNFTPELLPMSDGAQQDGQESDVVPESVDPLKAQDGDSAPEQSEQFSPGQVACEDVVRTSTSPCESRAAVKSASNAVEESSVEVLAAGSVAEEETVVTTQLDKGTEHSAADSSGGEHGVKHARLKKPRKPSLLSTLGNHGKKAKPSLLKSSKKDPSLPSSQRRFSSHAAVRMFSLTNTPQSASRKAKSHTTSAMSKHLHSKKRKKELSGDFSHEERDGKTPGDVPSVSELLADGSLWDS